MRMRGGVAALAGASAAACAHLLDASGRLPFVHETAAVRAGMSATQVAAWLAVAAIGSALAASSRIELWGPPLAVAVTATPELLGRHDPGALAEPGALIGAALQLLVLVTVVAVALLLDRRIERFIPAHVAVQRSTRVVVRRPTPAEVVTGSGASPRAPPSPVAA